MILSRFNLKNIEQSGLDLPPDDLFDLPEKVLQFGTGVLLRGLPDYFINKANRQGFFKGRVVVIKSTDRGGTDAFGRQDGLYTQCIRGMESGQKVEENIVNASISRVLSARSEWDKILKTAHDPNIQIIISNTTEVGIQLVNDDIRRHPPDSFPGKLLAFLYERYKAFAGSRQSGMVVVPTELITDNGKKLESIVLELAHLNQLEDEFLHWIEDSNTFCSSLVDRIVPGHPDAAHLKELEQTFGYKDDLLIMSEAYRLWAIEGDDNVKEVLSFSDADRGVVIVPDIDQFRELKLRMLNGTHTLSCGLANLAGFQTVKEAMDDPDMSVFISRLMQEEIGRAIPKAIDPGQVRHFGEQVLDRFRNPYIEHLWLHITVQYTSKMRMRNIPILLKYVREQNAVPPAFSLGFAAYLLFLHPVRRSEDGFYGSWDGKEYLIKDDYAAYFYEKWSGLPIEKLVPEVLRNAALWGEDLTALGGFEGAIMENIRLIGEKGARQAIQQVRSKKVLA